MTYIYPKTIGIRDNVTIATLGLSKYFIVEQLKKQATIYVGIDAIEYFYTMAQEAGIPSDELINLYLQDYVDSKRKLSIN